MTTGPGTTSDQKRWVVAGLAQVSILLVVYLSFLASIGGRGPGPWGGPGIMGLSLAPIGWGLRKTWLSFGAVAWGTAGLVMNWLVPTTDPFATGGALGHWDSLSSCLAMMLASTAAVAGQWVNLNKLPLPGSLQKLRGLTQLTIVGSLLVLLRMYEQSIIPRDPGWASFYIENGIVLLFLIPVNLAITALTLIRAR